MRRGINELLFFPGGNDRAAFRPNFDDETRAAQPTQLALAIREECRRLRSNMQECLFGASNLSRRLARATSAGQIKASAPLRRRMASCAALRGAFCSIQCSSGPRVPRSGQPWCPSAPNDEPRRWWILSGLASLFYKNRPAGRYAGGDASRADLAVGLRAQPVLGLD